MLFREEEAGGEPGGRLLMALVYRFDQAMLR